MLCDRQLLRCFFNHCFRLIAIELIDFSLFDVKS